jgi:hypothetical protein
MLRANVTVGMVRRAELPDSRVLKILNAHAFTTHGTIVTQSRIVFIVSDLETDGVRESSK